MPLIILIRVTRALSRAAAPLAALLLGGCGGSGEEVERPAPRPEVERVIASLQQATARRNFAAVCALLADEVRARAGGRACPARLQARTPGLRAPRIEVLGVRVRGRRASARVRTSAHGQPPVEETIELLREGGSWRISALAS